MAFEPTSFSAFTRYFRLLPELVSGHANLRAILDVSLGDSAIETLSFGLAFKNAPNEAGAGASIALRQGPGPLFDPDPFSAAIEIGEDDCYLSFAIEARAGASFEGAFGDLSFGAAPQSGIAFANHRRFPKTTKLREALQRVIAGFVIPGHSWDLPNIPAELVVTVTATGSLKVSGSVNLLAVANPLAAVRLPDPLPEVSVNAGGSVEVNASVTLSGEYQVRAHRSGNGRVSLGWYRNRSKEFTVGASAGASLGAGIGDTDLLGRLMGAISPNPKADEAELDRLPEEQAEAIRGAIQAAAARRIELAVAAEGSAGDSSGAAFLYEVDPAQLAPTAAKAVDQAFGGNFSLLHAGGGALAGVAPLRSIWTRTRERGVTWTINLLGVLNFASVSKLLVSGTALYDHQTGDVVLTDRINAERVRVTAINFAADAAKLRKVLADSVLLTLVYRGTRQAMNLPVLDCRHSFYETRAETNRPAMLDRILIGVALGAVRREPAVLPAGVEDFGRTTVHAEVTYDHEATTALFLNRGVPRPVEEYEAAGRTALQLIVREDAIDAVRRRPTIDDDLWRRMKSLGPANFDALFSGVPSTIRGAIVADYLSIRWWADAMAGAAVALADMRRLFPNGPVQPEDRQFVKLRQFLADHMADVVEKTTEEFGKPWGLLATFWMSGGKAPALFELSSPMLTLPEPRISKVVTEGGV